MKIHFLFIIIKILGWLIEMQNSFIRESAYLYT